MRSFHLPVCAIEGLFPAQGFLGGAIRCCPLGRGSRSPTLESKSDSRMGHPAFPCFRFGRLSRCRIELLGVLQGIPRELVSLLAEFVSGSMICFAVGDCCDGVGVGCQIVKFCGLIVRTLRHSVLLSYSMQTVRPGSTKNLLVHVQIDSLRPLLIGFHQQR